MHNNAVLLKLHLTFGY